jgi:threonyl-tRNA synthetase
VDDIDHRVLGNKLDLFHQQEEGPGMVFWHPRGWELYRVLEDYIRRRMRRAGFREIRTPQLLARSIWERSGHGKNLAPTCIRCPKDRVRATRTNTMMRMARQKHVHCVSSP